MEIEVLTLADSAQNYQNKLIVVGTFNTINAAAVPFDYSFSLACRFRFLKDEPPFTALYFKLVKPDGTFLIKEIKASRNIIKQNEEPFYSVNLVLNFESVTFPTEGSFSVDVSTDNGYSWKLPIIVKLNQPNR